jgi:hypothetical protein
MVNQVSASRTDASPGRSLDSRPGSATTAASLPIPRSLIFHWHGISSLFFAIPLAWAFFTYVHYYTITARIARYFHRGISLAMAAKLW